MGGQHEGAIGKSSGAKVVDEPESDILAAPPKPKVATKSGDMLPSQTQVIRHHFDPKSKQVHLHADVEKIKVGMAPMRLEMILAELRERRQGERSHYDSDNKTLARFQAGTNEAGEFDIWVNLELAEKSEGPVIGTLDKFLNNMASTSGKKKKK